MPCTAKKMEILKKQNTHENIRDIDCTITVRELGQLLKRQGIQFKDLKDSQFDNPLGESTGAAIIFGVTGGVMEAALRTAADTLTGKSLESVDYKKVRGTKGIKEATIDIAGQKINVVAASGLANARKLMEEVKNGNKNNYHFIEIMACPGGCVNGGGMPIHNPNDISFETRAKLRAKAIYKNGGITLSGGEPLIHQQFCFTLAKLCFQKKINLAFDTSGCTFNKKNLSWFQKIIKYKPL
jgi:NADP-reducing hydrogenase subunit HndD